MMAKVCLCQPHTAERMTLKCAKKTKEMAKHVILAMQLESVAAKWIFFSAKSD